MSNLLRGFGIPPVVVGFARGLLEAVVLGAIAAAIVTVSSTDFTVFGISETWSILAGALALNALRTLEGLADQIDKTR